MRREYLSPDAAAALLGWVGPDRATRLLRVIRAKEYRLGREIMVRLGGRHRGVRYKLTEALLRRYCPELFLSSQDELVSDVRRHLSDMETRVEATIDERTAPQFEGLRAADARLASEMGRIAARTSDHEGRIRELESRRESARVRASGGKG